MKKINNCSLIAIDCYNYGIAVSSLRKSMAQCEFDKVLFFTDTDIEIEGIETIKIPSITSKDEYSQFLLKEAWKFIDTEFVLVTQHDSWILNADSFDDGLYKVDYAGALWLETDGLANGNGGFSWRSKKLMDIVGNDTFVSATTPEDVAICRVYRSYLEKNYGLVWASDELCEKFAFELREPSQPTFGFHNFFHRPYKPHVILKRSGAGGDIILMEPIMRWFNDNGFQVVLDVPMQFFELFSHHDFFVRYITQLDNGRIKPERMINLDMAYEVMPYQNYVKSYFEVCGIEKYKLTKPQLFPKINNETKLFQKYAVIHIDQRETKERNVYGIKWNLIQECLEQYGYTVVQIGKNDREVCGTWINTPSVAMMKYVIAGCDLFLGVDSMPSNIAIAYDKPCILFFGSVDPNRIHVDLKNVEVIQGDCDHAGCWHIEGGTSGKECIYKRTDKYLQCCTHGGKESQYDTYTVIDKIKKLKS